MLNYQLYALWSANIYVATELFKTIANACGFDNNALYVRALPIMPAVIGALSGLLVGPEWFGWTAAGGAFLGVGAAGVAALSHSVHRQTIKGDDARLDHLRGATKEVDDE